MGLRRVRGVRTSLPQNTVVGRRSGGKGAAELVDLDDLARDLQTYGPGAVGAAAGLPAGGLAGQVLAIVAGVATWTYTTAVTAVGIITSGTWRGTKVDLAYGGTNADLSATGGASKVLKQTSVGGAITVAQLAASDLSNGVTGSGAVALAASPVLSGHPTGVTESAGDNSTRLATTAYVATAVGTPVTTLAALTDVSESGLANNDLLRYQTSDSKWHNVAKDTYSALITVLGTIATGVWNGTKIGLGYGGTNADLSGTGGASQVLKQLSTGAAVTVGQLAASDLSNGVTGSGAVVLATSPALLTTPTAPTAAPGTSTTQLATTAFVAAAVTAGVATAVSSDWDDPFIGAWSSGGWGTGAWGGLYYGTIPPSTAGQLWMSRGEAMTPEWSLIGDNGTRITYNGSVFVGSTSTPADTTATTTVHKMAGYAISFTPLASGQVRFVATGIFSNNTANDGMQFQLRYGTGTAPTAGGAVAGTAVGNLSSAHSPTNFGDLVFTGLGDASLTVGTVYWVDAEINTLVGSTANYIGVTITLRELP